MVVILAMPPTPLEGVMVTSRESIVNPDVPKGIGRM
jgi:hypothetical protein